MSFDRETALLAGLLRKAVDLFNKYGVAPESAAAIFAVIPRMVRVSPVGHYPGDLSGFSLDPVYREREPHEVGEALACLAAELGIDLSPRATASPASHTRNDSTCARPSGGLRIGSRHRAS